MTVPRVNAPVGFGYKKESVSNSAFGLMVAIPLLVIHAILTSKTGDIVDSLEMATVKALNVFSRRAKRAVEA